MDGKPNASPELPLPMNPAVESAPISKTPEAPLRSPEMQPQPAVAGPPTAADTSMVSPQPVAATIPQAPPVVLPASMPADDVDVIEKQWVDKAKAIVAATHSDPRLQNQELSKVKASYIKNRFHKDIRVQGEA